MRELAPATCFHNRFAPGACSLMYNQFDSMEQIPGANILWCNNFFRIKSLVNRRELCPRSMLWERVSGASSLVCTGLERYYGQPHPSV